MGCCCQKQQHILLDKANQYFTYGQDCQARKKYSAAIKLYTQAIKLDPSNPEYYRHRGFCYDILKNSSAAESDFKKIKSLVANYRDYGVKANDFEYYRFAGSATRG